MNGETDMPSDGEGESSAAATKQGQIQGQNGRILTLTSESSTVAADGAVANDMVQQAAAAYARLLKESKNPLPLSDFVSAFMSGAHTSSQELLQQPQQRSAELVEARRDAHAAMQDMVTSTQAFYQSSSSSLSTVAPRYDSSQQSDRDHSVPDMFQDLSMSSQSGSLANSLFNESSRDDLSWADDLSNSLIFGDSSTSTTSVGTPGSAATSWSRSHSKHASFSSVHSGGLNMGSERRKVESIAAFAVRGSPTKPLHGQQNMIMPAAAQPRASPQKSGTLSSPHHGQSWAGQSDLMPGQHAEQQDILMPLRRSKRQHFQGGRTASPPTALVLDPTGAQHHDTESSLIARSQVGASTSTLESCATDSLPYPRTSFGPDSADASFDWSLRSPTKRDAAVFDDSMSPAVSTSISEPLRSRSSTLASVASTSTHSVPGTHSRATSLQRMATSSTPSPTAAGASAGKTGLVRRRAEFGDATYETRLDESKQKRMRSEQKRQADLTVSFQKLKACLGGRLDGRMIKVQVLECACARIQELEKENIGLHGDRRSLMDENARLKHELQALAQQLQATNVATLDRLLLQEQGQRQEQAPLSMPFAASSNMA
ncbi:hypothetical protein K437DRAFT_172775 [Tilletiaria anomala UBC 951]|uniref:BHLH domain-containing protein n=1 Tax=Tilletiaria anomala (strain ATCC 24038 / CBS 436.72 / UBC 951) TaxID=1037660 RepID=A0A066VJ50_TILAU|nr:uncharacterized protein K437DRAFT_172775 [Tilletiaria anomala UBC 951]KDN41521.1 hypothetical protein K437DRAFT_172775 [Tilletiaria anomala UBC 951]